jgi:hypothetical protein
MVGAATFAEAALHIQRLMGTVVSVEVVPAGGLLGTSRRSSPQTFLVFSGDSHTYTFDQTTFDPPFAQESVRPGDRVTLWYEKPAFSDVMVVAIEDESLSAAARVKYTTPAYRDPQGTHDSMLLLASVFAILALLLAAAGTFRPRYLKRQPERPPRRQVVRPTGRKRRPSHHTHN